MNDVSSNDVPPNGDEQASSRKPNGHAAGDAAFNVDEAVGFLKRYFLSGPWAVTAILPETGKLVGHVFFPEQERVLVDWLAARIATANLYFHANEVRQAFRGAKAKRADI